MKSKFFKSFLELCSLKSSKLMPEEINTEREWYKWANKNEKFIKNLALIMALDRILFQKENEQFPYYINWSKTKKK